MPPPQAKSETTCLITPLCRCVSLACIIAKALTNFFLLLCRTLLFIIEIKFLVTSTRLWGFAIIWHRNYENLSYNKIQYFGKCRKNKIFMENKFSYFASEVEFIISIPDFFYNNTNQHQQYFSFYLFQQVLTETPEIRCVMHIWFFH